ncbi:hypothetical protein BKA59DRAFT_546873 [Fusarium tricinctum]|uniref:Heterokaryon incompatibility domain-containing protein n=1 Tax=Fusarium tricinctum TaxID=61284 RepID=A0A8K0RVJ3_9HYPO|nr:hypothetical protein BKA59DRAFT_546873 [Fusarium tricinctum]
MVVPMLGGSYQVSNTGAANTGRFKHTNSTDTTELPRRRALGVRYVWIDSFCIFQDSQEDFFREAATMGNVYMNALCTFSICWESPNSVLGSRNPEVITRWTDVEQGDIDNSDRYAFVQDHNEWAGSFYKSQINQRGWALQEQLLSRRILYLDNNKLYWECNDLRACELEPRDDPRDEFEPDMFDRCPHDTVPSWSWASSPGPIIWTLKHHESDLDQIPELPHLSQTHVPLAYLHNTTIEPLASDISGQPKSATLELSCLLIPAQFKELNTKDDIFKPIEDSYAIGHCVYMFTDGFVLPLPHPHSHRNLQCPATWDEMRDEWRHIAGLVVQSHDDGRGFVRMGGFSLERIVGKEDAQDFAAINALRKHVPVEENEFEVKLRMFAKDWTDMADEDLRSDPTTKGQWTTVRLVRSKDNMETWILS